MDRHETRNLFVRFAEDLTLTLLQALSEASPPHRTGDMSTRADGVNGQPAASFDQILGPFLSREFTSEEASTQTEVVDKFVDSDNAAESFDSLHEGIDEFLSRSTCRLDMGKLRLMAVRIEEQVSNVLREGDANEWNIVWNESLRLLCRKERLCSQQAATAERLLNAARHIKKRLDEALERRAQEAIDQVDNPTQRSPERRESQPSLPDSDSGWFDVENGPGKQTLDKASKLPADRLAGLISHPSQLSQRLITLWQEDERRQAQRITHEAAPQQDYMERRLETFVCWLAENQHKVQDSDSSIVRAYKRATDSNDLSLGEKNCRDVLRLIRHLCDQ